MRPMDPLDAAMMTAELVSNPMHVGAVLILSPPPNTGKRYVDKLYREALADDLSIDPRLRRYPHRGVDTGGIWTWRELETLDLSEHCQRRTVGEADFWRLIGELDAQRLDRSRPMWMSYLIDGLDGGRFAFYIQVHHTVIDGVAGFQMIADALTGDPKRRSMPPFYADCRDEAPPPPAAPTGLVSGLTTPLRSLLGTAASGVGLIGRAVTGEISTVLDTFVGHTTVLPFGAPYTRFNGRLGPERAVSAGSWAKKRFHAVQQAAGVTGNDVVTATVAGVLRTWLDDRGELPKQSLVAACPITVRTHRHDEAKEQHGNKFGLWLCPLGTNLDDPAARLDLIHRSMSEGKSWVGKRGSAASLLTAAGSIAATVIFPLLPLTQKIRTGYNLPISYVPGPPAEMYWNGAHIDEMYPVSTVYDGQSLNVTTCSYADRVGFGYAAGADTVPDIGDLIPLTERCLAELESAVGACT
ncbi:MAG: wax ester/triacylglycerol synthase family O-acyltransferase [Mycobacterium sp.]